MTGRTDIATLDEITSIADTWLRRCGSRQEDGEPADGIPVNRWALRAVLAASTNISVDESNIISWTAAGRRFTAEPAA